MRERKLLTLTQAKADGDGPGRLAGYGSTFGGVDSYRDTIVKGAYAKTIPTFLRDGFIPWGHDWVGYPVATPEVAREDDTGLWIEAEFHSDPESQRARSLVSERLSRGKSMGLSIGYEAKGWDIQEIDGQQVRRLLDIELYEVSLVMVPADPNARVADVKSADLKRHLTREHMDRIIAILLEALSAEESASDDGDPAGDGKSADPAAPPDLDLAGAKLLDDLGAYVARLKAAPPADVLATRAQMAALLRQIGTSRMDLDALLCRADALGETAPRELFAQFTRLDGLYGPTRSSRQAG